MNEDLEFPETDATINDAVEAEAATADAPVVEATDVTVDVVDDAAKEDAAIEVEAASTADAVEELPEPKPKKKQQARQQTVANAVITPGADADVVYLSKCVYKNKYARKSLTVHHLQRRLNELGYREAYSDKDGWFGDLTRSAVRAFQKDNNIEGDGTMNVATFEAIFANDPNVVTNVVS